MKQRLKEQKAWNEACAIGKIINEDKNRRILTFTEHCMMTETNGILESPLCSFSMHSCICWPSVTRHVLMHQLLWDGSKK